MRPLLAAARLILAAPATSACGKPVVPLGGSAQAQAELIQGLLVDPEARAARARQQRAAAVADQSRRSVEAIVGNHLSERGFAMNAPQRERPSGIQVELSPSITRFNRVMRDLVEGRTPSEPDTEAVRGEFGTHGVPFRALFEGFWVVRSSPLARRLATQPYFSRRRSVECGTFEALTERLSEVLLFYRRVASAREESAAGNPGAALQRYGEALRLNGGHAGTWMELASVWQNLGESEQASSAREQADLLRSLL